MRAALYIRVSSQEQAHHGVSLAEQKERLQQWAKLEGWEVAAEYADEGYSGGTDNRPDLQRLMSDSKNNLFDIVAVTKIDRFFRNNRQLLNYIHELDELHITFMAQSEAIDTSKPGIGNVVLSLLGSVAQWERERISERIRDFRNHLALKGQWSSGRTPFGYRFDKDTKELIIDPLEAEAIRFIFRAYTTQDIGIVRTAELCNTEGMITPRAGRRKHTTWGQSVIRHILTHPAYKGGPNADWQFTTPPIITPAIWDAAKRRLASNRHFRANANKSPYQGLLRCGLCNHTMRIGYNHSTDKVWECPGRLKSLHLDGSPRCQLPRFPAKKLEIKLEDKILHIFSKPENIYKYIELTIKELEKQHRDIDRQLKPIEGNITRLKNQIAKANIMFSETDQLSATEYVARIKGLRTKITELKKQADVADPMLLRRFDDIDKAIKYYQGMKNLAKHDENEKEPFKDLISSDILNATTLLPDADFINHPAEVGSQQLRKLGLFVYMFTNKIEIKGTLRQSNTTSGWSNTINLPLSITLPMGSRR